MANPSWGIVYCGAISVLYGITWIIVTTSLFLIGAPSTMMTDPVADEMHFWIYVGVSTFGAVWGFMLGGTVMMLAGRAKRLRDCNVGWGISVFGGFIILIGLCFPMAHNERPMNVYYGFMGLFHTGISFTFHSQGRRYITELKYEILEKRQNEQANRENNNNNPNNNNPNPPNPNNSGTGNNDPDDRYYP